MLLSTSLIRKTVYLDLLETYFIENSTYMLIYLFFLYF